ncbi:proteinase inhibitor I78 [Streptomyces lunaelactis]|uniref:I78 family peptidase inhibitor n=1 Tax=Streptomyces lunaelactis TaxID=1535768 RepID=UPI0015847AA2|nr:I78 family peptidase inhibitor [Streptomyces lunaelactis]NUK50972.1 proteinase inhibitor I78 [Streptomyces lunaelactis]NUK63708.1 proteinase inhibitor I78 [Streptomyces lunaelactis]
MAPIPTPPAQPDDAPESYVGLAAEGAEGAEQLARERGWTTVRSLPPGAIITMEYLVCRLNFEVEGGTVVRCWIG